MTDLESIVLDYLQQPNILPSLSSIAIEWREACELPVQIRDSQTEVMEHNVREASELPVMMRDSQTVVMGHNVIVGGGWALGDDPAVDATVYLYDINRDKWGMHSIAPTYQSALTTYHSQLVVVGGREVGSGNTTNSVYVFDNKEWCPSIIPAMTVARSSASAVSKGQHLIVAGGMNDGDTYDSVEVFDGDLWKTAKSLPKACYNMKSVLQYNVWYVCGGEEQGNDVYSAPLLSIVESTRDAKVTVWTELPTTPHHFSSITAFGQWLLAIGGGWPPPSAVHAFSPHSHSWLHVGELPFGLTYNCSLALPNGELMTLGGESTEDYSKTVFIGHIEEVQDEATFERVQSLQATDEEKVLQLEADNKQLRKRLEEVEGKNRDEAGEIIVMNKQLGEKVLELEADNKQLRERLEEVEGKNRDETGEILVMNKQLGEKVLQLEADNKQLRKRLEEVEGKNRDEAGEIIVMNKQLGEKVLELEADNKQLRERLEEVEGKNRDETGEILVMNKQLGEKVLQLEADNKQLRERLEEVEGKNREYERSLEESGEGGKAAQKMGSEVEEKRHSSPEKMGASIRGADIVARTTLTLAAGEGCAYEWKGHGLRLQVPTDALEPPTPPTTMIIQASLSGHYKLPDHTQLVSGVYWITFPRKFSRPVTLELQHCASLQPSQELASLSFISAKCNQEKLPYNFKPMTGGVFSKGSQYGTLELTHFSGVAIASEESENRRYTAHTYYIPQSVTTWLMHFAIICKLELLLQALQKYYSGVRAEAGPYLEVTFDGDEVALEIEEDGVTLDNGWSLVPLVYPIAVLRESVDNYKPGEPIPSCQLELYWTKREQRPDRLKHRVKLTGVKHHTSITITRDPAYTYTSGSQLGEVEGTSTRTLRESADGDSRGPPTADNVLDINALFEVNSELIDVTGRWRNIGLALKLKDPQLGIVQSDNPDITTRLTDMLRQWLNKTYDVEKFGQPSWQMLIEAVRSPAGGNNPALAAQIADKRGGRQS